MMKKIFYFALSIVISLGACENDNYNCYSDNSLVHFHEERNLKPAVFTFHDGEANVIYDSLEFYDSDSIPEVLVEFYNEGALWGTLLIYDN